MPKEIKEIYQNPTTGEVSVEYSDDSINKFNIADTVTAVTDPVTGGIDILSGETVVIPSDAIVYASKFGVAGYANRADSPDQTDKMQAFFDALSDGMYGVLPGRGWAKIGGDLLLPVGADIQGALNLFSLNPNASIPRFKMQRSSVPFGRNTVLHRMRLWRIGADLSLPDGTTGDVSLADLVFDGTHMSGYLQGAYSATGADAVIIGNLAYQIHFVGAYRINNFTGWAVDVRCNTARDGSGDSRLATGVNLTFGSEGKFYNMGGNSGDGYGGYGGGVRCVGSPQDSGTIQLSPGMIFDGCGSALWIDNSNQQTNGVSGSGGTMVVTGSGLRIERCGRLTGEASPYPSSQPVIYGRRAVLNLTGIHGLCPSVATGHKYIDVAGCKGTITGVVTGVDAGNYLAYNDLSYSAPSEFVVDVIRSGGKVSGVSQPVHRRDNYTYDDATLTFVAKKVGATGSGTMSVYLDGSSGQTIGEGNLAASTDNGATNIATGLTAGGSAVAIGSGQNQINVSLLAGGIGFYLSFGDRTVLKATNPQLRRNTTTASISADCSVQAGGVNVTFKNMSAQDAAFITQLGDGAVVEFSVTVSSLLR